MAESGPLFRPARPAEAAAITDLIVRSKRSWGYSDEVMVSMAPDLGLAPVDIEVDHVEVLEVDGTVVGMFRLQRRVNHVWLEDLFIDPAVMGGGLGRRLFERAAECAREWGYHQMRFESDPNAAAFYLQMGARVTGSVPSTLMPGRELPLMEYAL